MDFPKHIDTISMGSFILCFKGTQVEISKLCSISPESSLFAKVHEKLFTSNQNEKG